MARTMFEENPTSQIYRVVVEVRDRDGNLHKWYNKILGPYVYKPTAKGVLTKEKKSLDIHISRALKNPRPYAEEAVSYEAWIEEGEISWKKADV